jgi:hypothetical protein
MTRMSYEYLQYGSASEISNHRDRRIYRFLELQPGVFAWLTLAAVVAASYWLPTAAAVFIIGFDIYWLVKTVYLSVHMNHSFRLMRANQRRNWIGELAGKDWHRLHHLVVLPMASETYEVVRESFSALTKTTWPLDRMVVVLTTEERIPAGREIARRIADEFGGRFARFIATEHPGGIAGELKGKSANATWGAKKAVTEFDALGIPHEDVIVSTFDVDTVAPPDYFACLAWHFLTAEHPQRSSFQPIPVFTNNIWHAPSFARVFAFSTTFWQMIQQARPEQLVTFSSQSIGLRALVDAGFWQVNVVSEFPHFGFLSAMTATGARYRCTSRYSWTPTSHRPSGKRL